MGSTVSATESMSHIHSVDNMISDTTDQEANGKGQMTWTQFDEVDIEGKDLTTDYGCCLCMYYVSCQKKVVKSKLLPREMKWLARVFVYFLTS